MEGLVTAAQADRLSGVIEGEGEYRAPQPGCILRRLSIRSDHAYPVLLYMASSSRSGGDDDSGVHPAPGTLTQSWRARLRGPRVVHFNLHRHLQLDL